MLKIIKIGGNIVDNPVKLQAFLADFAALPDDKILVHGGGKVATAISAALGIETTMINGRRVTDARTLEVVTMVYNGINKQIVSTLQSLGCNAAGLCGADGRLIVSRRRAPEPVDYGFVGDPVEVNVAFARSLVAAGFTLVVAPITLDGGVDGGNDGNGGCDAGSAGWLLNTNADTIAQTMAVAMTSVTANNAEACNMGKSGFGAECNVGKSDTGTCNMDDSEMDARNAGECPSGIELIYCFEKQGVLLNVDDENSVIPYIDRTRFAELKASGAIHSGMLPKLENAFRALEKGVARVVICAAENIAKPGYGGTTIGLN